MKNLPVKIKKASFLRKLIDNVKLSRNDKNAQNTIQKLKKHPKFHAYKSEFVKYSAHLMCENDSDLCVFFADGDGLRSANQVADETAKELNLQTAKSQNLSDVSQLKNPLTGEQLVDKYLDSILLQIQDINNKLGYTDAIVGIQGDEIFIAVPHLKEADKLKLYENYSKVQSGIITISVRLL